MTASDENLLKDFKKYQKHSEAHLKLSDIQKNASKFSTKIPEDSLNLEKVKQQTAFTEGDSQNVDDK